MEDRLPRKLAAILYADVAGYSQLTEEDEEGTHRRLSENLDLISSAIDEHQGRVVHYAGDAVLADFATVTDALSCATGIQNMLARRNEAIPKARRVQFRIGVNIGEVIVDRDDIYGDGVNIAARLESLAEPGGICVSDAVRTAAGKKLDLVYERMGEQSVKNISEPVRAFKVILENDERSIPTTAKSNRAASSDNPSIAVLPFTNMSGDPEQEYFSDGITEDIITELSRFRTLSVLARNSSFQFRGQSVDIQEVAKALSVQYVLEGSVRKAGKRVRITAQLIDASSGHHLWAERFDRELEDVFEIQDEVARSVVGRTASRIEDAHLGRVQSSHPSDMRAYDFWLRGKRAFNESTLVGMDRALELFKQAIEIDPEYARGYASLGFTHNMRTSFSGWGRPIDKAHETALELAKKAVALDESDHWNHFVLGWCHLFRGNYGEARRAYDRSISINPNDAEALIYRASFLSYVGDGEEALKCLNEVFRLDPMYPEWFLDWAVTIALFAGDVERALELSREAPKDSWPEMPGWLAVVNGLAGDKGLAKNLATQFVSNVRRLWIGEGVPGDAECVRWLFIDNPVRRPEDRERILEGFRTAGLRV